MLIRGNPIYLSDEVHRMLRAIVKANNRKISDSEAYQTKDQLADCLLRKAITEQFPQLVEIYGRFEAIEDEMVQAVAKLESTI